MMQKLNKPRFFSINSWLSVIGIIDFLVNSILLFIPEPIASYKFKIVFFITTTFICFMIYLIYYLTLWHKFYKDYEKQFKEYNDTEKNRLELSELFKKKQKIIQDLNDFNGKTRFVLFHLLGNISAGILPVTDYEKEFLKNLYDITNNDIKYLYDIKEGEDKNEQ